VSQLCWVLISEKREGYSLSLKKLNQWKIFKPLKLDKVTPVLTKKNFVKVKVFIIIITIYWIAASLWIVFGEGSPVLSGLLLFGMILFNPGLDGVQFIFKGYERYLDDEAKEC